MSVRMARWEDASEFWRLYGYLSRALALRRAVTWGTRLLLVGLIATLPPLLLVRAYGLPVPPLALLFVPGLLGGLLGLVVGFVHRERPERAVRMADNRLDLKERLTTALELVRVGSPTPIQTAQVQDAVTHFSHTSPLDAFPVRIPRRSGNLVAVIAVLLVGATLAPNPFAAPAQPVNRNRDLALAEASKLQQLQDELGRQDQTAQTEEIRRLLAEAQRALEDGTRTPEESLATLTDLEERLYRLGDADAQGLDAALAALSASLAGTPGQQDLAKRLATSDLHQVSRDLRRLASDQAAMPPADRAQLAAALQQAARSAARANQRFANQLQQAAQAMQGQNGDPNQAQQALNAAADQTDQVANRDQALAQAQSSRARLARGSGQQQTAGAPQNGASQRSQSQGQKGQGQNGQSQNGSGQQDGGAQQGAGQPGAGDASKNPGQPGQDPGGQGAGQGSSNARDSVYDPLFTANRPEQVPGQQPFDPSEVQTDPYLSPAQQNDSQVGYRDVYGQYQQRAVQNIEQSYVPLGLKDLVKDYFDALDPNRTGG